MPKKIGTIKAYAREHLKGHYGLVVGCLLFVLVVTILLNLPFTSMVSQGIYFGAAGRIVIGIIGVVVVIILAILFYIGTLWIHLQLARGQKAVFGDILHAYTNHPGKFLGFIGLGVIVGVICLVPGILLYFGSMTISVAERDVAIDMPILHLIGAAALVAGIIVLVVILLSWSMAAYLLLDHEEMRVMEAIRQSRRLTKQNKWRRFILWLSFIGWLIFSVLTLFIALLWIYPYLMQSLVCFYLELLPPEERNGNPEEEAVRV